ncbi:tyrosine-protein phosphatase 10D isoform X3 [Pseudomyrmex gracilis]|nr:tyrosine-protein phosphatase 10D isoform X3 [Pseudomyrmex gracilis]
MYKFSILAVFSTCSLSEIMVLIIALVFAPIQFILCLLCAEVTTATPSNSSNPISTESIATTRDNLGFRESPASSAIDNTTESPIESKIATYELLGTVFTDRFSSLNTDQTSASSLAETTNHESTISTYESITKLLMTDVYVDDESSSPSTTDQTRSEGTTVDNVTASTTTTTDSMICDPTWPVNASVDTREIVELWIDSIGTEWIALSWKSPCDNDAINASIIYSVERCDDKNFCNQKNETNTWHNATDLDLCTQYTFTVKILTDFWESDGINKSASTNSTIPSVDNVVDLNVHNVSVNVIELVWQAPANYAKCISNYLINQCNETSCSEITVTATNYTANDLEPCTEYNFTVKTVTPTVESTGEVKTVRTTSPKLSKPERCEIIPGNFSLIVTWEPIPDICLKHYHISVDKFTKNTTETRIVVPNLHACMDYQVSISAFNKDDVEGDTLVDNNTTLKYKTRPPKLTDPGIQPYETNLTTYWIIEKENNYCELNSLIVTCNYTEIHGKRHCHSNNVFRKELDPNSASDKVVFESVTVTGLSPFTNYTCQAFTYNSGGLSNKSKVNATTLEDVPDPPNSLAFYDVTDSQFSLNWKEPECPHGNLQEFQVKITWRKYYPIPKWCAEEESGTVLSEPIDASTFNYTYLNATAFTHYEVQVKARTGAEIKNGWGSYSKSKHSPTNPGVPKAVTRFNSSSIIIKPNLENPDVLDTILTWGLPCSLNGELEEFEVSVHGIREGFAPHSFSISHKCEEYIDNNHMCLLNLEELRGEYNYSFTISAKVKNVDAFGEPTVVKNVQYPAGIPLQPDKNYIDKITIDPYKMLRSTTTATVLLPLFTNETGNIRYYAIMVSKMGNNKPISTRFDLKSKIWPNASSWEEAMMNDFSIPYQATLRNWDPYSSKNVDDYGNIQVVKYTIGEDATCKSMKKRYCNGPLKPDTWYHVRMRAFTFGGYSDSDYFVVRTNAELNVVLVIGAVFGILLTGILVTMMLLVRKCSPYLVLRRFLHSDMPGSPVPAPFTRKKFISHCQQLIDNPGKLSNEFRLLQTLSVDLQMPTNTACLQANRKKNRYSDILPYDFSRVKLEVIDNDPNTDYINASFIKGYTGEDEYIACQGPKEETTYDFWRMVDQYNINIIVMLTQLVEKGKEKCHQYYPAIRETFRYENMTIRCTSELDFRTHTQRTLVLQKEKEKRSITHLHFKDWPDHDVPEDFDAMIHFCQIMRRNISANKGFIVVHCSAGIGRTGTLIAIDILLQHLRDNRKLDVFGTVYRLRHHRINMVQRESQYAYIYNCIKQVLKNPYFLKTYKPPPVEPIYENVPKKTKDATNSDINLVNNSEL